MTGLLHDAVYNGWDERPEDGRESSKSDVRYFVFDVVVTDAVKVKVTIIANEPALERIEEFGEGWMDVEEVFPTQIVRGAVEKGCSASRRLA